MNIKYNTIFPVIPDHKIYRADMLTRPMSDSHPLTIGETLKVVTLINADGKSLCVRVEA